VFAAAFAAITTVALDQGNAGELPAKPGLGPAGAAAAASPGADLFSAIAAAATRSPPRGPPAPSARISTTSNPTPSMC
jgi:hypothetical protein